MGQMADRAMAACPVRLFISVNVSRFGQKKKDRRAVAQRFRGEFEQKVDAKGRVSIPADFRRVIEEGDPKWSEGARPNFVIVYGLDHQCWLECYTITAMEEIEERLDLMQEGTPEYDDLILKFQTFATTMQIDDDGRIVLPQKLRDKLALDGDGKAVFASSGKHFQIWEPSLFKERRLAQAAARAEGRDPNYNPIVNLPKPA
jgi:MraZ protein